MLNTGSVEDIDEMYDIVTYMLRYFRDQLRGLQNGGQGVSGYGNFAVADTLEVLLGNDGKPDLSLFYDEVHPNSKGFGMVAEKIREDAKARGCWPV